MKHSHCLARSRAHQPIDAPTSAAMYGRLFPELPSFSAEQELLFALGRAGGLCDCGGTTDEPASLGSVAAGWPFLVQFVAHDITADRSAPQAHAELSHLRNARSPRLNLEGLYGDGPVGHPFLFQRDDPAKLLTAPGGRDLLRNTEGTAYRYDHSQIRHTYRLNADRGAVPIFPDLLGFRPVAAEHHIEWPTLFDAPGAPPAARAKKIDGRLVGALIALPVALTGATDVEEFHSLAGARIVGEVLIGLLDVDDVSVRHAPKSWTPSATLIDLLMGPARGSASTSCGNSGVP